MLLSVPPHCLELVALLGRVHITSPAVLFCLDRGITVAWFTVNGSFRGRLMPAMARSADLRLLQYAACQEPAARLALRKAWSRPNCSTAWASWKTCSQTTPVKTRLAAAIATLKDYVDRALHSSSFEQLLGLEGIAARTYFDAYATTFRGEICFTTRERQPPPDPANALLSFGYVLLGNILAGMIEARGLDPALGFFHEPRPGRASLALDLVEELRHPLVDRFVLRSCNLRILRPQMFQPDPERAGGVRLTPEGLKQFFFHWERFLLRPFAEPDSAEKLPVLTLLRRQVDRFAADLRGQAPYQPFRYGA